MTIPRRSVFPPRRAVPQPTSPLCSSLTLPHQPRQLPQVVPLSLQKLRDLADSLRASMPVNDEQHPTRQWRGAQ